MSSLSDLPVNRRNSLAFDAAFYLSRYPDLQNAFGSNADDALTHWATFGISEGRRASREFDVQYYLAAYGDLKNAFGNNYGAALDHWMSCGIPEGRRGSREFDVKFYLSTYGYSQQNYREALGDWIDKKAFQSGWRGSRDFDVSFYLSKYDDLQKAFGKTNYEAAFSHWLNYGISEGRQGAADATVTDPANITHVLPPACGFSDGPYSAPRQLPHSFIASRGSIANGQYLASNNGKYFAILENGGLSIYKGYGPCDVAKSMYWRSNNTPLAATGFRIDMQADGNFCLYRGKVCTWSTNTPSRRNIYVASFAVMQDDGNFCVYRGESPAAQGALAWSLPNTVLPGYVPKFTRLAKPASFLSKNQFLLDGDCLISNNGRYFAAMEAGVLSIYQGTGTSDVNKKLLYKTGYPPNNPPSTAPHCAIMLESGRLTIFSARNMNMDTLDKNTSYWATPNWYQGNCFAVMQDDGNFCIYKGTGPTNNLGGVWCFAGATTDSGAGAGGGGTSIGQQIVNVIPIIVSGGLYIP